MTEQNDSQLLAGFVATRDQQAFAALVDRHVGMVYGCARRQVGDANLAEDVAQAVFILLAKKAHTIRSGAQLPGWLVATTRFCSRDTLKRERRRRLREQAAATTMRNTITDDAADKHWQEIEPLIDDAMSRLAEPDRSAVALRYLEGQTFPQVATALGISVDAAEKRVWRAIERLRESFRGSDVVLPSAAISGALTAHGVTVAPAHLAATITRRAASVAAAGASWGLVTAAAAIVALCLATVVLATLLNHSGGKRADATTSPALAPKVTSSTAPGAASPRIKVGILVSEYTATGPCWTDNRKQFGYLRATSAFKLLNDASLELFAIIEPGTNRSGAISNVLRLVPVDHVLDGGDVKALENLDVIASCFQWDVKPEVLSAMKTAVSDGVGFLFQAGVGSYRPGHTPDVQSLQSIHHALRFYYMSPATCQVVADHPLVAEWKALADKNVTMTVLSGSIGAIDGTPLIVAPGISNMLHDPEGEAMETNTLDPAATQPTTQPTFCPLYVSHLGKGRIVACQWETAGSDFRDMTKGRFHIHAVQWLANRSIE